MTTRRARPSAPAAPMQSGCTDNDCGQRQARAMEQIADSLAGLHAFAERAEPHLKTFAEIGGKWLRFCQFIRRWVPKLWWLPLILAGALPNVGSELSNALISALTAYLQMQTGG